jgi:hypothetical protein
MARNAGRRHIRRHGSRFSSIRWSARLRRNRSRCRQADGFPRTVASQESPRRQWPRQAEGKGRCGSGFLTGAPVRRDPCETQRTAKSAAACANGSKSGRADVYLHQAPTTNGHCRRWSGRSASQRRHRCVTRRTAHRRLDFAPCTGMGFAHEPGPDQTDAPRFCQPGQQRFVVGIFVPHW